MSFLNNLVNEFTHKNQNNPDQGYPPQQQYGQGYGQQQYGGQQSSNNGPPQVAYPWVAEWDNQAGRWIFVNRETGQRTHEYPQQAYGGSAGYGGGYPQQGGYEQRGEYYQGEQPQKKDHHGRNMALGVAAGVAGGALLMHEGEKVEEKWDEDKYRLEQDVSGGVQDVEDFPDDAARWTGRKVQDVEDIPQDVERKWDNAVQDVEDVPDDVARWTGNKVGDVERFDDGIQDSYDQGRDDARYDDDNDRY